MNRVVVTGIGMVSPLGLDRESTWEGLVEGRSGVDQITSFDTCGYTTTIAAEVKDFEPESLLGRKEARRMDRHWRRSLTLGSASMGTTRTGCHQWWRAESEDS